MQPPPIPPAISFHKNLACMTMGNASSSSDTPQTASPPAVALHAQTSHARQVDIARMVASLRDEIDAERNGLERLLVPKRASGMRLMAAKASVAVSDSALNALQALQENSLETIQASDRVIDSLRSIIRTHGIDAIVQQRTLGELQNIIALTAVNALAFTDHLTGLPNRRVLGDRLKQMLLNNRRWECFSAAIYPDLDKFKRLNDEFGHECGDELLVAVGNRLKLSVRQSDTVARYGGDEFVILLARLNGNLIDARAEAEMIAKKILSTLTPSYVLHAHSGPGAVKVFEYAIFASLGVVMFGGDAAQEAHILDWADEAMYWAKNEGGKDYRFYDAVNSIERALTQLYALGTENDIETSSHGLRTRQYVKVLAQRADIMNVYPDQLNDQLIQRMYKTTQLHDIGKSRVPYSIIHKNGKLSATEWDVMKTHTTQGKNILEEAKRKSASLNDFLSTAVDIASAHHEWWDGSGYPDGLAGLAIPLAGRFMCIADVYDALISKRAYKAAWTHEAACETIISSSGSQFDPVLVEAFKREKESFWMIAESIRD